MTTPETLAKKKAALEKRQAAALEAIATRAGAAVPRVRDVPLGQLPEGMGEYAVGRMAMDTFLAERLVELAAEVHDLKVKNAALMVIVQMLASGAENASND